MEDILKIGKFSLMGLILLITLLGAFDLVSVSFIINFSMVLFWAIIVVSVGFAIFNFAENPKTGIRFLAGIVALLVVVGIGYLASDVALDKEGNEVAGSRLTEAGIYTFFTLAILSVVLIGASEAKRLLKL